MSKDRSKQPESKGINRDQEAELIAQFATKNVLHEGAYAPMTAEYMLLRATRWALALYRAPEKIKGSQADKSGSNGEQTDSALTSGGLAEVDAGSNGSKIIPEDRPLAEAELDGELVNSIAKDVAKDVIETNMFAGWTEEEALIQAAKLGIQTYSAARQLATHLNGNVASNAVVPVEGGSNGSN